MVRSKELNEAVLVTEDMPAAPEGHAYALWLQHDDVMVPAGIMPAGSDNKVVLSGDAATANGAGDHRRDRRRGADRARATTSSPCSPSTPRTASMTPTPQRIAVVGSGVAGLTAAYVASRTAHVTLFEADDRLGGHADTHVVRDGDRELAIDTGFIVHNPRTYPVLLRLFAELGVVTQPSEMSMSIRDDDTGLRVGRRPGRRGVFPTSANLRNPRYLRMLTEIPRFHRRERAGCWPTTGPDVTLREFLDEGRFTAYFHRHFMEPLVAAVWSCDPEVALDYPARYLFTFLEHHGMLGVFGSPQWRTVTGGSQQYVAAVAAAAPGGPHRHQGHLGPRDLRRRRGHRRQRRGASSSTRSSIATHPGQALAMLAEPTAAQRDVLAAMPYSTQHRAAAHRHLGAAAARGTPGRRGTSPGAPAPRRRCWSPTT